LPWVAAGDAGRVDIVWYQSNNPTPPLVADPASPGQLTGGPNMMPPLSTWTVKFAQSLNANSREPVFAVTTASDHINHNGSISIGGLTGSSDRSLLDYFEVAIGPDGLANILYADNGVSSLHVSYARQNGGPLALTNPSSVTCLPIPPLTGVVSRKVHGVGGPTFDIDLPLVGPRGVESRGTGSTNSYTLIFTFMNNLTSVTSATVTGHDPAGGTGTVSGTPTVGPNPGLGLAANQCLVNLTGVSTGQYITVTLNGVVDVAGNNGPVTGPQMGVLVGDVNVSARVDGTDVSIVRQQNFQALTGPPSGNFREDIDFSGRIDGTDVSLARQQNFAVLPSSP
jgi:hypothetical protein